VDDTQDDVKVRPTLPPSLGFWLDHWLTIHADETPPLLGCKPLGLRGLHTATRVPLDPVQRRSLIRAVSADLASYRALEPHLSVPLPSSDILEQVTFHNRPFERLGEAWVDWIEAASDRPQMDALLESLSLALAVAITEDHPFREIAFLSRRRGRRGQLGAGQSMIAIIPLLARWDHHPFVPPPRQAF